jgi:predicted transcriptional regulator
MIAKLIISNNPEPIKMSDTGADILYQLDENRLQDLPVVDKGNLIGSISDNEIYSFEDPDLPLKKQKITLKRDFVYEHQHLMDVIHAFAASKLTLLPVLDENEKYLGCIKLQRLIEELSEILEVENKGSFIVLEINQNDYVLSEIAKIVESQDSKILNLFVVNSKETTKADVILKINSFEIQTLIQTFNRYNYIIKATYTENEKMYDDLRDRYDSLMKYLSI